ncbi:LytR/AlgR family response regulator transcription factor [Woeseia oceani]|uniref:DNA-binding response regulator n=1 Tax=Woeseia oceani TaxID=1548547 RepID=A0A193LC40_9GAMM|nr:response regulator [Woeseia oceani]ANO49964.1 DNA-binding response regulator [Woeseia oceani]
MNILIVDDEPLARQRLRMLVEERDDLKVVGEAANGHEALTLSQSLTPDVVLLDIRMPGINGIETAQHLSSSNAPPAVIFTTAYEEYAIQAFDAHAVGYVLKPVRRERLYKALAHAARINRQSLQALQQDNAGAEPRQHVCARVRNELKLIPIESVVYFQADQKYVRVRHDNGDNLIDDSLKLLEHEFSDRFVRIHRSALVSLAHIEALEKIPDGQAQIRLRGNTNDGAEPLLVSRRHLAEVRRRLKGS